MLSRVPLFPLFLKGNATPTIPHKFQHPKGSAFQFGTADAAVADGSRGSNFYEVNPWLWQFVRGRPHMGGMSVSETEGRRNAVNRAGPGRFEEESRDPTPPRGS